MKLEADAQCPICQKGTFVFCLENVDLSYEGATVQVPHVEYYQCSVCQEGFYSKEAERRLDKAFADLKRSQEGLLTSDELREIRTRHNLSQEKLSLLLGMAPKTLARYENGTVIQSKSTDILLRLIKDNPSNLNYLGAYISRNENDSSSTSRQP